MVNRHECPKCGSTHWDYANVGLPDAILCTDCGCVYPEVMSLFPKVVKTNGVKNEHSLPKGAKGSSPNAWPFPTALKPQKHGLPKYNPNNEEEAPI